MRKFTADFETNVDVNDCRVWAYAICEIGNIDNFIYGNNIKDFIDWCSNKKENYVLYFHNLKFDGEYIFSYLLSNGYELIRNKKERRDKTFTCLISDMGQFYSIEIFFDCHNPKHINKVTIYDSLKILNFSVEQIAKDFNLPIRKLELDYEEKREIGHVLTDHEIEYIKNDVEIMARALEIMFNESLTKMTIGSSALKNYRESTLSFLNYFPELPLEIDQDIRQAYRGGFTYCSPTYAGSEVGAGIVLDVNSLYPSVMYNEKMPFGYPIFFEGQYKRDVLHPLYIQMISCEFKVKKNMIPTIQIKHTLSFLNNEYVEETKGEPVTLALTNIDLELFFEHYDVYNITYHSGWKFKQISGLFTNYIDCWTEKKIEAKKNGNGALYRIAKLMLNSLYGKFSKNPITISKYPYLDPEEIIKYNMGEPEVGKGLYIPVGCFITAYARRKTIETSQKIRNYTLEKYNKDYYIYSDTDSIHMLELPEDELKTFLDIDDYRLGAWKLESRFRRGKFIRQKCYIEEEYEDKLNVTIAGLPKKLGKYINFDNFEKGFTVSASDIDNEHKLTYKHVKGGVMLVATDFTIK